MRSPEIVRAPARSPWVLSLVAALLTGCGERAGGTSATTPASANDPGTIALLVRIRGRVTEGSALKDAAWNQDVAQLQRLLWPAMDAPDAEEASRAHVSLVNVAGSVGSWRAMTLEQQAKWAEPDGLSVEIHRAWLQASALAPDDYRAWCAGAGREFLARLAADRARLFEHPDR